MAEDHPNPKIKRQFKNYFIAPREQLLHAFFTVLSLIVGMGIISNIFLLQVDEVYGAISQGHSAEIALIKLKNSVVTTFLIVSLLVGTVYFMLSYAITHRIFGALFVIERYLKELLQGMNPKPIHLRRTDQVKRIANLVSELGTRYQSFAPKNAGTKDNQAQN